MQATRKIILSLCAACGLLATTASEARSPLTILIPPLPPVYLPHGVLPRIIITTEEPVRYAPRYYEPYPVYEAPPHRRMEWREDWRDERYEHHHGHDRDDRHDHRDF
jgi:hypothetical protein